MGTKLGQSPPWSIKGASITYSCKVHTHGHTHTRARTHTHTHTHTQKKKTRKNIILLFRLGSVVEMTLWFLITSEK